MSLFCPEDASVIEDIAEHNGSHVHQPDNTALTSQGIGNLPLLNKLSKQAQEAMILKNLKIPSLVSMGELCDDVCTVVFTKVNYP